MCMMRSRTHAGSAGAWGRLVLTNEHHCSWKNPASWIVWEGEWRLPRHNQNYTR
jgi:hypothetical protein